MYAIWKACERFDVLPPGVKPSWDEMDVYHRAYLIAYNQVRDCEIAEAEEQQAKAMMPKAR